MKTFTAEQFKKRPAIVYRSADREGVVLINNAQYHDRIFELVARERGQEGERERAIRKNNFAVSLLAGYQAKAITEEEYFKKLTEVLGIE